MLPVTVTFQIIIVLWLVDTPSELQLVLLISEEEITTISSLYNNAIDKVSCFSSSLNLETILVIEKTQHDPLVHNVRILSDVILSDVMHSGHGTLFINVITTVSHCS